ncbi:MAG TPA: hypothetical protein VM658_19690 [bacterium]|nr:hypothetical protein [bacterium]
MPGTSHGALILVSTMPLLGLGVLAVVLLAMAVNRDRWIVPGSIAVIIAASGWAAAVEYGPQARKLLARSEAPAQVAATQPSEPQPDADEYPGEAPEASAPGESAAPSAPARRSGADRRKPAERGAALVPMEDRRMVPDERETSRDGRRTIVVNPAAPPLRPPEPRPAETPRATPVPTPTPAPKPIVIAPPETWPAPAPTPPVENIPRVTPPPAPAPAPAAGFGTLVVTIRGPLVETSQAAARQPHVLAILDGKKVDLAAPTRTTESHQNDNPNEPLLAVTYFWENITFTFSNLEAGWHVLMLDTALDDPRSHQARMTGSGQDQNDYNGAVEIKAGKTTYMQFGAKNFMSGKLPNPGIR